MATGTDANGGRPHRQAGGLTAAPAPRRSARTPSAYEIREEWLTCALDFPYWCNRWAQVYDAAPASAGGAGGWLPFRLWPAQRTVAATLQQRRLVVMLKARQLGVSWLVTAYGLWLMLFHPAATVLLFSKRDTEAVHLLSFRLRGMHTRLPRWMQAKELVVDNVHELRLSNGSAALAFPTTGGRSYTGTLAVVDEADYVCGGGGDLEDVLDAVKPTIDAGGRLVLVSTVDKSAPGSAFKRIYEAAKAGENGAVGNGYAPVFLPWTARPDRTAAWYEGVKRDIWARSGSYDSLYAEYPATDVEALAPLSTDARFAAAWCSAADDSLARVVTGSISCDLEQAGTTRTAEPQLGLSSRRAGPCLNALWSGNCLNPTACT